MEETTDADAGPDRWLRRALVGAVLALGCAFGIQKIRTFDYWWHLRTGALISETGSVPRVDVYSYTVPGAPWIDIHWLFQLGLHGLHSLAGHGGVVIAKAVCIAGLLALVGVVGWRRDRPWVTAFALALMLAVAGDRFMPRPELPSFLFLAAVLWLLERDEERADSWLFAIVAIQLVWSNVHGLFALGVAACAIYTAAEVLRPLLQPGAVWRRRRIGRLGVLTVAAAAVAVLNPNGLAGALYPIEQLGMIGPPDERGVFGSLIAELIPPVTPRGLANAPGLALALALSGGAFAAMLLNWRRLNGAHPLLWVAFTYLGLAARRNLALMAIVCTPLLVRNLNDFLDRHPVSPRVSRVAGVACLVSLLAFVPYVADGSFFRRMGSLREPGLGPSRIFYPEAAVDWIERQRPRGPIAHHMADGGYLIWRLHPDYPVMADGRLEVYGAERFAELQISGPDRFRALDDQYHFGTVVVHYSLIASESLLRWLHLNSNWRLVFLDEIAAVFVRVEAGEIPRWLEIDVDSPDLFDTDAAEGGEALERFRLMARTNWFTSLHRFDRALATWEQMIARYPRSERADSVHAVLLSRTGKVAAAEAILRRLLEERPRDKVLLAQVGDLRLSSQDLDAAKQLYERALAVDPRFYYAVLRRAAVAEAEGDTGYAAMLYTQVLAGTPPLDPHRPQALSRLMALEGR